MAMVVLHSDWSLLLLVNLQGSFIVASYPGRVGGERCLSPPTRPGYEAIFIVNKIIMLLENMQSSLHCKQGTSL